MLDLDAFVERAAIMEFEGCMTRFDAETQAARAQGVTRYQALEGLKNANGIGDFSQGRNNGSENVGNGSSNLPGVQRDTAKQDRSMSERVVPVGRGGVDMLALRK